MRDWGICPKCKKPTKIREGMTIVTAMYFPPIYDENGINTNPDKNQRVTSYTCLECGEEFSETK